MKFQKKKKQIYLLTAAAAACHRSTTWIICNIKDSLTNFAIKHERRSFSFLVWLEFSLLFFFGTWVRSGMREKTKTRKNKITWRFARRKAVLFTSANNNIQTNERVSESNVIVSIMECFSFQIDWKSSLVFKKLY